MTLLEATTRRGDAGAPQLGTTGERRAAFPRAGIPGLALVVALGGGCISLVSEGKVGDREVRVDGTGFAWLDATEYRVDDGGYLLADRQADDVTLHLVFTSAVFDPGVDLRALSTPERDRVERELEEGDLLYLRVRRGDRLLGGDQLGFSTQDDDVPEAGPYLSGVDLVLGAPPLERDAAYPKEVEPVAKGMVAELSVGGVEPRVLGVVEVKLVQAREEDRGAEGELTVRFDVERVSERIAECNFAPQRASLDGSVDPCGELRYTGE